MSHLLLALTLVLPLAWALALVVGGARGTLVRWCQLAAVPGALLAIWPGELAERAVQVPLLLGMSFRVDLVARPLLLVGALLYGAALTAVTLDGERRPHALAAYLLVSYAGNMAVYLAWDTVTFYLAYAVMSFSAYGLVIFTRTDSAMRAGRVYITLTVLSEAAVLIAVVLLSATGGRVVSDAARAAADSPYRSAIVACLIVGFGVKAGLVPLHLWLPLAHPAAPPAASAVLSGAMVKAGLVGWLRFLPLGAAALPGFGLTMVLLALVGSFGAVIVGAPQRDPKAVLAYSTISQMGFLSVVIGVALARPALTPACVSAAVIYAVHHGLAKGALFLGVPVWKHQVGQRGLLVVGGLVVAGLAVVGAPLSAGSVGKYAAKYAVADVSVGGIDLVALLPYVATGSTILLVRFVLLLRRGPSQPEPGRWDGELLGWLLLVVTSATVPWLVTDAWVPVSAVPGLDPVTVWAALWPILLGFGIAGVVAWLIARSSVGRRRASARPLLDVPPGDLVVPATAVVRAARTAAGQVSVGIGRVRDAGVSAALGAQTRGVRGLGATARLENRLGQPAWGGLVLLIVLAGGLAWAVWAR